MKTFRTLKPQGYGMENDVTSAAIFRIEEYCHADIANKFLRNTGIFIPDYNPYYSKAKLLKIHISRHRKPENTQNR